MVWWTEMVQHKVNISQAVQHFKPTNNPNFDSTGNDDTLMTVTTYTGVFVLGN
jgi:hypothetical protein